jgi:hypothetical protein
MLHILAGRFALGGPLCVTAQYAYKGVPMCAPPGDYLGSPVPSPIELFFDLFNQP